MGGYVSRHIFARVFLRTALVYSLFTAKPHLLLIGSTLIIMYLVARLIVQGQFRQ